MSNPQQKTTSSQPPPRQAPPDGPVLRDLAGMSDARKWGEALAQDLKDFIAGRLPWAEVDPGCVLHGPPGTGKTTFARALAATKSPEIKRFIERNAPIVQKHLDRALRLQKTATDGGTRRAGCPRSQSRAFAKGRQRRCSC